jgi:hypothetical protein
MLVAVDVLQSRDGQIGCRLKSNERPASPAELILIHLKIDRAEGEVAAPGYQLDWTSPRRRESGGQPQIVDATRLAKALIVWARPVRVSTRKEVGIGVDSGRQKVWARASSFTQKSPTRPTQKTRSMMLGSRHLCAQHSNGGGSLFQIS